MTIYEVFKTAIELGIAHDFRPREEVMHFPWHESVQSASGDSFVNPYPDSGIVWVDNIDAPVHRVAVGIDLEEPELSAIKEWERSEGKVVDLFIGHHSEGRPLTSFPAILRTQLGNLKSEGVNTDHLDKYFDKLVDELVLDTISDNFNRVRDIAGLLKCNYLSLHSPVDNLSARFVEHLIQKEQPQTLGQCRDLLAAMPEYSLVRKENQIEPMIPLGKPEDKLGRYLLTEFVGGEEGPLQIYDAMHKAGIDTIISMHMSPAALKRLKHDRMHVIAAGHSGSDSIGLNLLSDRLEKNGIEVIPIGGFVRCPRLEVSV